MAIDDKCIRPSEQQGLLTEEERKAFLQEFCDLKRKCETTLANQHPTFEQLTTPYYGANTIEQSSPNYLSENK